MEVTKWLIALGKRGRGGTRMSWRNLLLESSWCKSSPVKAVAGRPVASVAIRRATGGCEAYTASSKAVLLSVERPIVGAFVLGGPRAALLHCNRSGVSSPAGVGENTCKRTIWIPQELERSCRFLSEFPAGDTG